MKIIPCKAVDIINHPDFEELKNEYIEECANAGLPRPEEKIEVYRMLDNSGYLYGFAAMQDMNLYGFIFLMCATLPHYGRLIATTESLFVAKKFRKTGAGLELIRSAERLAKDLGSPAIIISAPINSSLDSLLPRLEYCATNTAYTKTFL